MRLPWCDIMPVPNNTEYGVLPAMDLSNHDHNSLLSLVGYYPTISTKELLTMKLSLV